MNKNFTLKMVFICCLTAGVLNASYLHAQWSDDPGENNVVIGANSDQSRNCIVSDGLGNFIIGWRDLRNASNAVTGGEVYAQKFSAEGYVQWSANGIQINATTFSDGHINPLMVKSENGNVITVWLKMGSSFTDPTHLYAQKTDGAGNSIWGGNVRVFNLPGSENTQKITPDHSNGVVVVCSYSSGSFGATKDVIAQRINSSGSVMWESAGLTICNASGNQMYPSLTTNNTGDTYFAWKDSRSDTGGDIYVQRVDSSGNVKWNVNGIAVCNDQYGQEYPTVINDGSTGVIIVWVSNVNSEWKIYVQRIDESGNKQWGTNGIKVADKTYFMMPALLSDGAGGAIIVWGDTRGSDNDVYAQKINSSGLVQWASGGVLVSGATGNQSDPVAIADGANGAIAVWKDYRSDVNGDIYAQRINSAGSSLWQNNGLAVCTSPSIQESPSLVSNGNEGAVICWDDRRNGTDYDIYAQEVDKDGKLGGAATMIEPQKESFVSTLSVSPNPASGHAEISFSIPRDANVDIRIFDISGRQVSYPLSKIMNEGIHTLTWETGGVYPGLYIIKLTTGKNSVIQKIIIK